MEGLTSGLRQTFGPTREARGPRPLSLCVEIVDDNRVPVRVCERVFVSCGDASRGDRPARPLRGAVASVPSWARANFELQVIKQ